MPPLLAQLTIRQRENHIRLWLPLFLLWLLLLPVALIVSPIAMVGLTRVGTPPLRVIAALLGVLNSLSGTVIDFERAHSAVFVRFV